MGAKGLGELGIAGTAAAIANAAHHATGIRVRDRADHPGQAPAVGGVRKRHGPVSTTSCARGQCRLSVHRTGRCTSTQVAAARAVPEAVLRPPVSSMSTASPSLTRRVPEDGRSRGGDQCLACHEPTAQRACEASAANTVTSPRSYPSRLRLITASRRSAGSARRPSACSHLPLTSTSPASSCGALTAPRCPARHRITIAPGHSTAKGQGHSDSQAGSQARTPMPARVTAVQPAQAPTGSPGGRRSFNWPSSGCRRRIPASPRPPLERRVQVVVISLVVACRPYAGVTGVP